MIAVRIPIAGHDQREDQALVAEGGAAQDQAGHQRDGVGLEQVRGHAGAVADVVADVVGDRGGVAWVVLGDALLDLADQVGADVGGLGEDPAADTHEHGQQRGAEPEALQHRRRLVDVDQHDDRRAEQAESGGGQPDRSAGAERDLHRPLAGLAVRRGRHPDVGPGGQPHAQIADRRREDRADQEEDRPADAFAPAVSGEHEQQQEDDHHEYRQGAELAAEVGRGTLLDRLGDLLHLGGAGAGGEHAGSQHERDHQRDDRDDADGDHDRLVAARHAERVGGSKHVGGHRAPGPSQIKHRAHELWAGDRRWSTYVIRRPRNHPGRHRNSRARSVTDRPRGRAPGICSDRFGSRSWRHRRRWGRCLRVRRPVVGVSPWGRLGDEWPRSRRSESIHSGDERCLRGDHSGNARCRAVIPYGRARGPRAKSG